ncbi:interleukin 17-like protein [Haliotis cracherodii]|uniref:interleukin 17-like protein n=1 Tax=Haliotis cracherodii TaxID=6455 RepID=UPI0039EA05AB
MCLDIRSILKHLCLMAIVGWTPTITQGKQHRVKTCRDPPPMEASFYMLREFHEGLDLDISREKQVLLYGARSCKQSLRTARDKGNGSFPLCPVFYKLNYDSGRVPELIAEAKCACVACGGTYTGRCAAMFYYRPVLELVEARGCYRRVVRRFQNGCVCRSPSRSRLNRKKPPRKRNKA